MVIVIIRPWKPELRSTSLECIGSNGYHVNLIATACSRIHLVDHECIDGGGRGGEGRRGRAANKVRGGPCKSCMRGVWRRTAEQRQRTFSGTSDTREMASPRASARPTLPTRCT